MTDGESKKGKKTLVVLGLAALAGVGVALALGKQKSNEPSTRLTVLVNGVESSTAVEGDEIHILWQSANAPEGSTISLITSQDGVLIDRADGRPVTGSEPPTFVPAGVTGSTFNIAINLITPELRVIAFDEKNIQVITG